MSTQYNGNGSLIKSALSLFLVSVFGLYLELLLIRWLGTEIRIFAYFQNTVLVVCFMGIGLGCLDSKRPFILRQTLRPLLLLVALISILPTRIFLGEISQWLSVIHDLVIWFPGQSESRLETVGKVTAGLTLTLILMILILEIFLPLGRLLGRLIDDFPKPILGYSINIVGSLLGILLFAALSAFYTLPFTWLIVATLLLLFFYLFHSSRTREDGVYLLLIVSLSALANYEIKAIETVWSPYQKLVLTTPSNNVGEYAIHVNNKGYQALLDLSPQHLQSDLERYPKEMHGLSQYDLPYRFYPQAKSVLIVGAGSGNDAAGAVRAALKKIVAVDIDPVIVDFGKRYHPEKPYQSPAVEVVVDDARAYFSTTQEKFDLVVFGLLDSHTTTSLTNARLDHYVYTIESIEKARSLLSPGGVMVLTFDSRFEFITDRMAATLKRVFGFDPLYFNIPGSSFGWGGMMFVMGDAAALKSVLEADLALGEMVSSWMLGTSDKVHYSTAIASDDWPYIYLRKPMIPTLYYLLAGLMLVLLAYSLKRVGSLELRQAFGRRVNWHFFFMGAAFLLLEVQNISKASVLLGNTWQVNAVVIAGILGMILLANYIVAIFPRLNLGLVWSALLCSCIVLYWVDLGQFASLPYLSRALIVGVVSTLPMFFSGIIFARSFAVAQGKDAALGVNLIGSLVGALLQSLTFIIGIKALLLLVAALYALAMIFGSSQKALPRVSS